MIQGGGAADDVGDVMRQPEVAVVIVSYRSAKLVVDALASVYEERAGTSLRIRAVVVDNASGDYTEIAAAVAERSWDSWVKLIEAPTNGGFAYGNNLGIRIACQARIPEYVYLLNPDACVRAGAMRTLVEFLQTHPNAGIAGSRFETVDGSDWPYAFRFPGIVSEALSGIEIGLVTHLLKRWEVATAMSREIQPIDWICGASMMIRWAVFAAIGGMDEHYFLYFEETDFCYRAKRAGFSTWYVPDSRVMHIMGQSTAVTDTKAKPVRLPAYWFDSRSRYFAMTYGVRRAMVIDVIAVAARIVGNAKRLLLGRSHQAVPHYMRDLLKHSVLFGRNRRMPLAKTTIAMA